MYFFFFYAKLSKGYVVPYPSRNNKINATVTSYLPIQIYISCLLILQIRTPSFSVLWTSV